MAHNVNKSEWWQQRLLALLILSIVLLLQQNDQPLRYPNQVLNIQTFTKQNTEYIRLDHNHTRTVKPLLDVPIHIDNQRPYMKYDGYELTMNTREWLKLEASLNRTEQKK